MSMTMELVAEREGGAFMTFFAKTPEGLEVQGDMAVTLACRTFKFDGKPFDLEESMEAVLGRVRRDLKAAERRLASVEAGLAHVRALRGAFLTGEEDTGTAGEIRVRHLCVRPPESLGLSEESV